MDPENSYMEKIKGKVDRAIQRQRIKLQMHTHAPPMGNTSRQQIRTTTVRKSENKSTKDGATGKETGVAAKKAPQNQALLHKI